MNRIKLYVKIKEVYDELEYLVKPVVREDIRSQRHKLKIIMEQLESEEDAIEEKTEK
jgi:hypothetical protein